MNSEDDIIKMLRFPVDNIIVVFAGNVFQQIVGVQIGTNCVPLIAEIFPYLHEAEFMIFAVHKKETVDILVQFYIQVHVHWWCFVHNPTKSLRITWTRCIRLNLRSKTWQRATLLLLTWIYFCRLEGTVNFILPFMTKVTISISISQIFRSWVATYQLRPPMTSLSYSL